MNVRGQREPQNQHYQPKDLPTSTKSLPPRPSTSLKRAAIKAQHHLSSSASTGRGKTDGVALPHPIVALIARAAGTDSNDLAVSAGHLYGFQESAHVSTVCLNHSHRGRGLETILDVQSTCHRGSTRFVLLSPGRRRRSLSCLASR